MDDVVVINNKEYSKADVERCVDVIKDVWNRIKQAVSDVVNKVYEYVKHVIDVVKDIVDNLPVGLKRYIKSGELDYFESIADGKSNNWLRMHGLPLRRKGKGC